MTGALPLVSSKPAKSKTRHASELAHKGVLECEESDVVGISLQF